MSLTACGSNPSIAAASQVGEGLADYLEWETGLVRQMQSHKDVAFRVWADLTLR